MSIQKLALPIAIIFISVEIAMFLIFYPVAFAEFERLSFSHQIVTFLAFVGLDIIAPPYPSGELIVAVAIWDKTKLSFAQSLILSYAFGAVLFVCAFFYSQAYSYPVLKSVWDSMLRATWLFSTFAIPVAVIAPSVAKALNLNPAPVVRKR